MSTECPFAKVQTERARELVEQMRETSLPNEADLQRLSFPQAVAHIRHTCTNYENLLEELPRCGDFREASEVNRLLCIELTPGGEYPSFCDEAHVILKDAAYEIARGLHADKSARQQREQMSTELAVKTPTIAAILARGNGGEVSIADHDVAIRRRLADLVETTITASCNSTHTARKYRRDIGEFIVALGEYHFPGATLVERIAHGKHKLTVFDYGDTVAGVLLLVDNSILDRFAKSRKSGLHAVKTFLRVAFRDAVLTHEQATAMGITPYKTRTRRVEKPTGRRLSAMEVQFLRAAVDVSTSGGLRDLAIIDCMLYAGLRRQEVSELSLSDFAQDGGRWVIILTGKGGKVRKIALHKALYASLVSWLDVAGRELGQSAPVFSQVRKDGAILAGSLTSQTVSDMVARYGYKAGLATMTGEQRLTPHDARRTFARRLHDCGATLPAIQKLLGHADPTTTIKYIGLGEDDAKDAVDLLRY